MSPRVVPYQPCGVIHCLTNMPIAGSSLELLKGCIWRKIHKQHFCVFQSSDNSHFENPCPEDSKITQRKWQTSAPKFPQESKQTIAIKHLKCSPAKNRPILGGGGGGVCLFCNIFFFLSFFSGLRLREIFPNDNLRKINIQRQSEFITHFELTFGHSIRQVSNSLFCMWRSSCWMYGYQTPPVEKTILSPPDGLGALIKK